MKHLEQLLQQYEQQQHPAQNLVRAILIHSNSPEYLVANLRSITNAVEADFQDFKKALEKQRCKSAN